ncbi:DUF1360 domain-containing protein [Nonomuraea rubra]|uniref:DUF1360 domain-containing protein n=1 Tax=Nonomuraea rubra TaxID=46180 RepID=UPI0033D80A3F
MFLLALGLVLRVTRFLNSDVLFEPVRDAIDRRFGEASKIAYLVSCPWCASIYVAAAVMTAAYLVGETPAFLVIAAAATASYITGLISINLDD